MIALDTNILVAIHRAGHPMHSVALSATKRLIASSTPLAIPWPCAHEFFAIVTHKKNLARPHTTRSRLANMPNSRTRRTPTPTPRHPRRYHRSLRD